MGCDGKAKGEHLVSDLTDLPLGALTTAQLKEIHQAAGVHCYDHFGVAGIGQHKAGILDGGLFGTARRRLGRYPLRQPLRFPARLQKLGDFLVMGDAFLHCQLKFRFCLRYLGNLRRNNYLKIIFSDITLALHAE